MIKIMISELLPRVPPFNSGGEHDLLIASNNVTIVFKSKQYRSFQNNSPSIFHLTLRTVVTLDAGLTHKGFHVETTLHIVLTL